MVSVMNTVDKNIITVVTDTMDSLCKYKLGDELLYTAAFPEYHVKIVNRMFIENDTEDVNYRVSRRYNVQYGCIRLDCIDYLEAAQHELEEVK